MNASRYLPVKIEVLTSMGDHSYSQHDIEEQRVRRFVARRTNTSMSLWARQCRLCFKPYHQFVREMIVFDDNHCSFEQFRYQLMKHELNEYFWVAALAVGEDRKVKPQHAFDNEMIVDHIRSDAFAQDIEEILGRIQQARRVFWT